MERRLKPVRVTAMAFITVALLLSGPWLGWWTLAPLVVAALGFAVVDASLDRFKHPEWAVASAWVLAQVLIAFSVVLTGGPESPAVAWLAIPVVTLPARFDMHVVLGGVAFTALLMLAVTLGQDPSAVAAAPQLALFPIALLVAVACLSTPLMRSDIDHRTDSVIDGLTGMLNRRALTTRAAELRAQAEVTNEPVGLVIADLDRFKRINDEHGHAAGDTVLVDVAYTLRKELRAFDLAYRLGGEEFLVLLPGASLQEATSVAERLRAAIAATPAGGLDVTISLGVASSGGGGFDYERLFADADEALYRAKQAGRDRVVTAGEADLLAA